MLKSRGSPAPSRIENVVGLTRKAAVRTAAGQKRKAKACTGFHVAPERISSTLDMDFVAISRWREKSVTATVLHGKETVRRTNPQ